MNRMMILACAAVTLYLSGAVTSFAANADGSVPQAKDLNLQEMSSVIGSGRVYWPNHDAIDVNFTI